MLPRGHPFTLYFTANNKNRTVIYPSLMFSNLLPMTFFLYFIPSESHQTGFLDLQLQGIRVSLVAQTVKNPSAIQDKVFPICVLKNHSASVHMDQRHSHDKDSLSGRWPLRQAAKRVTSSLRDVPGARALPRSQTCSFNFQLLAMGSK